MMGKWWIFMDKWWIFSSFCWENGDFCGISYGIRHVDFLWDSMAKMETFGGF